MTPRGIVVEFIGIPGAGKSTIATALATQLSRRFEVAQPQFIFPRRPISWMEKLRLDVIYAPSFMTYRIRRLFYDFRRTGPGIWTASNAWEQSRYQAFLADKLSRAPKEIYVLDEWLLHRIVGESIARYGSDFSFTKRFAFPTLRTHQLIYVCVGIDPAFAFQRVLSQDQPFRTFAKTKDPTIIGQILTSWSQQVEQLRSEIDRRRIPCIDIDGSASIAANVETLSERIASYHEGVGEAPA